MGFMPVVARPAAISTASCSAMPTSITLSGNSSRNLVALAAATASGEMMTILSSLRAASVIASIAASRVLFVFILHLTFCL